MSRYESRQELADKIDYEGGINSFLQYGFSESEIDGEADPQLWAASVELIELHAEYQEACNRFSALLPEPGDY